MSQPTLLNIVRKEAGRYQYSLMKPADQPFTRAGIQAWDVRFDPGVVAHLGELVGSAVRTAQEAAEEGGGHSLTKAREALVHAGRGLYDMLLPVEASDLRRALLELQTPLLICTEDPEMLWEHLHDGEGQGFFGLKYEMGRSLVRRDVRAWAEPRRNDRWRCLMIADPASDLESASREARKLRTWLEERRVEIDYLEGSEATFEAVIEKLLDPQPYDIIHYAGHVVQGPDRTWPDEGGYALRLHGRLFEGTSFARLVKGSPLVFLNGCSSGLVVQGLTDALLAAGARVVVGSLFDSSDEGARAFAETFYEVVLDGQSVGHAMRQARSAVDRQYAAAWASFVMYGDPSLRMEIEADDLQRCLRDIELGRHDFETSSGLVLEQASTYARAAGVLSSAHLFAAMVGGEEPHLRACLRQKNVPPEKLQSAFQEMFTAFRDDGSPARPLTFSSNAQQILIKAGQAASSAGRKISELDLVRGFVENARGSTAEILSRLGVPLKELDPERGPSVTGQEAAATTKVRLLEDEAPRHPDAPSAFRTAVTNVGPLGEEDCTPKAWAALVRSAVLAQRPGGRSGRVPMVGTAELFVGLLQVPQGLLSRRLRALGTRLDAGLTDPPPHAAGGAPAEAACSANVTAILLQARTRAEAAVRCVEEDDLLAAFVATRGGGFGATLRKRGLLLEALVSHLFGEEGALDLLAFDASGQAVLEAAVRFAADKSHRTLGRIHLLYGLLSQDQGRLAARLKAQDVSAERLGDLLFTHVESGAAAAPAVQPRLACMSPSLVRVLCAAERLQDPAAGESIGERHLAAAWLTDGGGEGGRFLVQHGVKLRLLLEGRDRPS